jgi:hypothetical protein
MVDSSLIIPRDFKPFESASEFNMRSIKTGLLARPGQTKTAVRARSVEPVSRITSSVIRLIDALLS